MTEEQDILTEELAIGKGAQKAYNTFFKPFIIARRAMLFDQFAQADVNNMEQLKNIKLMALALDALEAELETYIQTGKMAEMQLDQTDKIKH